MYAAIVSTQELLGGLPVRLRDEDARHLRTVLRVAQGDAVRLFDGRGCFRDSEVASVSKGGVECIARGEVRTLPRAPVDITLFQCVAKQARMDWLVEKAQEMGVAKIVPVVSARCVVRMKSGECSERWKRIAEAALLQCGSGWLMEIAPAVDWKAAVALMRGFQGPVLIGALSGDAIPVGNALAEIGMAGEAKDGIGWLVGPEGDFTEDELQGAVQLTNTVPVSLGNQVLRVETAALFGVAATLSHFGRTAKHQAV